MRGEILIAGENLTDGTYKYFKGHSMPGVTGMSGEGFEFSKEFRIVIRDDGTPMKSYLKFFSPAGISMSNMFSLGGRTQTNFSLYAQEG